MGVESGGGGGGETGGRVPRSLKISGGRPPQKIRHFIVFFSVVGISLYRGKSGSYIWKHF